MFSRSASTTASGAAAVFGGLFLPWYHGRRGDIEVQSLSSGWDWLSTLDVVLLVVAVGALLVAGGRFGRHQLLAARAVLVLACVALFAVAVRIVSPPAEALPGHVLDMSVAVGPFVVAAGLAAIVISAGTART